jgi:hypothetical protein
VEATGSTVGYEIETDVLGVRAWCDVPLPFDNLSASALDFRRDLRVALAKLNPMPDELLQARFSGELRRGSDVENVLFYNVDAGQGTFRRATRFGVAFELGVALLPRAPSGRAWRCCYDYRLAHVHTVSQAWGASRKLARIEHVELRCRGAFPTASEVWFSVRSGRAEAYEHLADRRAPFKVSLVLKVPGERPLTPDLLKALVDGVTGAFQAHGDPDSVAAVAGVLAERVGADAGEVAGLLLSKQRAVLGVVPRLVYAYRGGVKWNPSDDRCVAADITLDHGAGGYALSGWVSPAEPRKARGSPSGNALSWRRSPIAWERYQEVTDRPALRIIYFQAGGLGRPGAAIAEVNVTETAQAVSVELVERELVGTYPNGAGASREQEAVPGCLEIELESPLDGREVIDTTSGAARPQISRTPAPSGPDREALSVIARGCPRWERDGRAPTIPI